MASTNSNLDSLHYDMVVGLTQNSINKKMKDMLVGMDTALPPVIYVFTDMYCTAYRQLNETETTQFLLECDPFSMPNGVTSATATPEQKKSGDNQMKWLFAFGFKATIGLPIPPGTMPYDISAVVDALPTIIRLPTLSGSQVVDYNLYYKDFQIVQQVYGMMGSWTIINCQQPADAPYIFNYNVNLDLSSSNVPFSELPTDQQAVLKNMDPSTMFSVNQLMLDCESPVLISGGVHVEDIDPTDPNYDTIVKALNLFTTTYFAFLEENGGAIFSISVSPVNTPPPPATIVPTDLNFIVKNYAGSGTPQEIEDLSTLNYLIMSNNRPLPSPLNNLTWDWLNQEEDVSTDGIMSVARSQFLKYLKGVLDPCFAGICLVPTPHIDGPDRGKAKDDTPESMSVDYTPSTSSIGAYTIQDIGYKPIALMANWEEPNSQYAECDGYGSLRAKNVATSIISINNNGIKCEFTIATKLTIDMYRAADLTSSTIEGYGVAQKSTTQYTIKISLDGKIELEPTTSIESVLYDDSGPAVAPVGYYSQGNLFDPDIMTDIITSDAFDQCVADMGDACTDTLNTILSGTTDLLTHLLNNVQMFVFPGGSTFTFYDCSFSDYQDFMTKVNYAG